MSERAFVRSEFFIGEIIFFRSIFLIMLMSHMRYNVERDLVDFWGRMVYDNVVNQPNHKKQIQKHNKINHTINHRIRQAIKKAIDSNKNAVFTHRLFKVGGAKHTTPHNLFCIDGQFVTITTTT